MAGKSKDGDKRPIIIKKIKKGGHGHHGGAWKVAYADFVTAMMAFFLLLWLLSSASKETLAGLSEYFTPTEGIKDNMGIGFDGGKTPNEEGVSKTNQSNPSIVSGRTPSGTVASNPESPSKTESDFDDNMFKKSAEAVEQAFKQDAAMQKYVDNVSTQQTPEGLRIDIMDSDKYAMFERTSAVLTTHGQAILGRIASIILKMPNYITITGHTDASPAEAGRLDYSNWELSSDRAQSARRFMLKSGIEAERPKRVVGMADRELYTPADPRGPKNRRIAILMLRDSHILIPDAAVPMTDPVENMSPKVASPEAATPVETPKPGAVDLAPAAPNSAAH